MEVDALDVSQQIEAHKAKYKAVEVERPIPIEYDLGNLAAFDHNVLDYAALHSRTDDYLRENTRDSVQLLVNHLFNLPTDSNEDGLFALLPAPVTVIPREKPAPKPKPPTRWEKFAKAKGIQKKKKIRVAYDEASGDYKPRYGYKGAEEKKMENWVIEVPKNVDPMTDMYAKLKEEKVGKLERNRKRERRNRDEAGEAGLAPLAARVGTGQSAIEKVAGRQGKELRKAELERSIAVTKFSTASLGKFDKAIAGEPKVNRGKKRTADEMLVDLKKEREKTREVLSKVVGKVGKAEPLVNARKAAAIEERSNKKARMEDRGSKTAKASNASKASKGSPPKRPNHGPKGGQKKRKA
ncbi:ribosome biogenesis regulatory protein-domain-containing protein [Hyaloraphidium curvatum]|nr:ribosome biogenesis regulatory protein-domain-containing protein [Hyaloraphidium curvatum]